MRWIKNFIFIVSILSILISCSQEKRYSWKVKDAFNELNKKNYKSAITYATDAIRINSKSPVAWKLRGRALYEIDDFNNALNDLRHAIFVDSSNTSSLFYIGLCYYDLSQYDSSVHYFNKAIKTKGSDSIYIEFNKEFLENTFDENISMSEIRFFRALCFYYKNQFGNAFKDFSFSADEGYHAEKSFYYMGLISLQLGKNDLACKYLNLSVKNGYTEANKYLPPNCK